MGNGSQYDTDGMKQYSKMYLFMKNWQLYISFIHQVLIDLIDQAVLADPFYPQASIWTASLRRFKVYLKRRHAPPTHQSLTGHLLCARCGVRGDTCEDAVGGCPGKRTSNRNQCFWSIFVGPDFSLLFSKRSENGVKIKWTERGSLTHQGTARRQNVCGEETHWWCSTCDSCHPACNLGRGRKDWVYRV